MGWVYSLPGGAPCRDQKGAQGSCWASSGSSARLPVVFAWCLLVKSKGSFSTLRSAASRVGALIVNKGMASMMDKGRKPICGNRYSSFMRSHLIAWPSLQSPLEHMEVTRHRFKGVCRSCCRGLPSLCLSLFAVFWFTVSAGYRQKYRKKTAMRWYVVKPYEATKKTL